MRERDDGRFVNAFPLEFPSGTGDLHQPRMRSDFTAIEWAQHLLRYYGGRMLASNRGHRVVWAISIPPCVNCLGSKAIWLFEHTMRL